MAKIIDKLSVFLPTYNEEENIKIVTLKVQSVLEKVAEDWEIIIVNDGSTDGTLESAQALVRSDKRIRLINHKNNLGYGATLKTGFYNARYPWIAMIDADGQFDFSEITILFNKALEVKADIVWGYRLKRKDTFVRRMNGYLWTLLIRLLLGVGVHDVDCGFKLVKKKVIDSIPSLESERGGMVSPELLAKAKKAHFKIAEVPVHHYPRAAGKPSGANLVVIIKSFSDLFKLWRKLG